MEMFAFASAVRGHRVYQDLWKPSIGEKLVAKQEFNKPMDKHDVVQYLPAYKNLFFQI